MYLKAKTTTRVVITFSFLLLTGSAELTKAQTVNVWLTTHDQSKKLEQQTSVTFASGSGGGNPVIVDETQTYQQIEGFGASFTDSAAWLLNQVATPSARTNAMNNLFTRNGGGIGVSFVRNPMAASDLARTHYSYDDLAAGKTDVNLTNFSIAHDQADIIPLVQQALQLNPQLTIMANPWSPPGWMKSSGSMIGGSLLPSMYAPFARYFVKYIQAYQAAGIPTHYISLQNEPLYVPGDYPGMSMDAATQITVLRDYVLPTLAASNITTKVLVYDHNWDQSGYPQTVFGDSTLLASSQVAGTAWHGYAGTPGVMITLANQFPAKGNYQTEHSGGTWVGDPLREDFAEIIHVMRCWGRAYVKWSLAQDQNYGPNLGGCNSCRGLVTVNSSSGAVTYNTDFYTLGHFSKFVLPGAARIYSANANGVVSAAFKNPDGSKAVVAFNDTTGSKTFQVQWGSQSFSYTLASYACATFTWTGTQTGTYTVNPANQIQGSSFNSASGIQTEWTSDSVGGYNLGYCDNGDYAVYKNVDFAAGFTNVTARVASFAGGSVEFRLDSPSGQRISSVTMPNTGNWQTFANVSSSVSNASGVHDLYLVFKGSSSVANLNSFQFGSGLPSPWVTADIGAVGATGSATYNTGTFEVIGSGADIEVTADEFRYVYQAASGDCSIVARVATQDNTDPWAKAGVMIRESTAAGSRNAAVLITPGNGVTFQRRTSTDGATAATIVSGVTAPRWVRLVRTANSFAAYYSANGVAWTQVGTSQTITMSSSATLGLAVTSHADGTLCTSTLDNVTAGGPPAQPTGLNAAADNNQVALNWTASSGATSYNVKRATVNGGPYTTVTNVATTNCTNTGLINGTTYYYVVSALNAIGESANSSQVSATPTNHPPVLAAIPNQTILAGRTLVVTNSASDTDVPPQLLTYSLPTAPSGVSIDTNSGVVTWRPAIAQSPSTQSVVVVVSDTGVPVMSATQSFWVTVNAPVQPSLSLPEYADHTMRFLVSGDVGPDYTVQMSTNLNSGTNWINHFTTNSPLLPFSFVDTVATNVFQQFYRIQLGPVSAP
jgi:glucosylceramidase